MRVITAVVGESGLSKARGGCAVAPAYAVRTAHGVAVVTFHSWCVLALCRISWPERSVKSLASRRVAAPMQEDMRIVAERAQDVIAAAADVGQGVGRSHRGQLAGPPTSTLAATTARFETDRTQIGSSREDLVKLNSVGA